VSYSSIALLDLAFPLDKVYIGIDWIMHDAFLTAKRDDLFRAWGILFKEYGPLKA
jgi:hypothetical protein